MSRVFEDIHLSWGGKNYLIRSNRVMGAIARIEDVLTIPDLKRYLDRNDAPLAKIAMAFGSVLRYAGAKVEDDEVYQSMLMDGEQASVATTAIEVLLMMMVPKSAIEKAAREAASAAEAEEEGDGGGSAVDPTKKPSRSTSSKKPTKRQSAKSG